MAKKSKTTKKSNYFTTLSRTQKFIVIAVVAIVGLATLRFLSAQSAKQSLNLNLPTEKVALSISDEKPMAVSRDESGKLVYESRGKSVDVTASGTVYCTPEGNGEVTAAQITQEEVDKILTDVKSKNPEATAADASDIKTSVGNNKQLILADDGSTDVLVGDQNNEALKQAEQILEAVCDRTNQTVPAEAVPVMTPDDSNKPTSTLNSRFSVIPKASAAGGTTGQAIEQDQINRINNERRARGLPILGRSECLTIAARKWTNYMATTNVLSHSNLVGPVENNCGANWWQRIGENVGYGGDSATIFNAYMNSKGHRENILRPEYQRVGVGAMTYKHPANPWVLVWTTQLFAQCKGACANK